MKDEKGFYTMKGYQLQCGGSDSPSCQMTSSMEDYLEMICRLQAETSVVRISALAGKLHVKPSSASKMVANLKAAGFIEFEKYGYIRLTQKGAKAGDYLLRRHQILHNFLCLLNGTDNELEQVEKIEHFLNPVTIANLERLTERMGEGW